MSPPPLGIVFVAAERFLKSAENVKRVFTTTRSLPNVLNLATLRLAPSFRAAVGG